MASSKKARMLRATSPQLARYADRICACHTLAQKSVRKAIEHARDAGIALAKAKAELKHGEWLPWLRKNCPDLPERTASHYMRLAERWPQLVDLAKSKSATVADLGVHGALEYLRDLDDSRRLRETTQHLGSRISGSSTDLEPARAAAVEGSKAVLAYFRGEGSHENAKVGLKLTSQYARAYERETRELAKDPSRLFAGAARPASPSQSPNVIDGEIIEREREQRTITVSEPPPVVSHPTLGEIKSRATKSIAAAESSAELRKALGDALADLNRIDAEVSA